MKDIRNSLEYNQWKNEVKHRDDNACRRCGFENNLHVHHIKPFKKYPEFAIELDNGLTLCGNCHSLLRGKEESTDLQTFLGDDANIGPQLKAIDGSFSNYLQRKLHSKTQQVRDSAASALFSHLKVYPNSLDEMLPLLIYLVDSENWANESFTKREAIGWLERIQNPASTQTISRHEQRIEGQRILQQRIAEQERLRQENEKREAEEKRQQEIISKYGSLEVYERHQKTEARKKSQEYQRLLNSVRAQFNLSNELDSRREEAKQGLSQHEQVFVEKYPSGSCLLDIGCASGRLCFALAQHGYTATGIDIAEKQIAQAKQIAEKKGIDVTFLHYEPPTLPFPDASFAAAFLENVYCYIPHRDARIAFLEEIARVLYSDGQLFISQPILDAVFDNYEPIYDDNYHQFATDYETLEEGDNFYLGASTYVHHFFFKDLKAEFDASPFQLLDSSVNVKDDDKVRCVLQKHVSD